MGAPTPQRTTYTRPRGRACCLGTLALVLLSGTSGCLFGGGSAEDEIDPDEATAREATYRSEAEIARDNRFGDRLRRRTDLSEPVRKDADAPER